MSEAPGFRAAADLLRAAVARRIFPAAAAVVGCRAGRLWQDAWGTLTFDHSAAPATLDTIFDLASLTKPLATTTVVLDLVARGRLQLDDPLARFFPEWRREDRLGVRVVDLLEHASGLPARLVDLPPDGRRAFERDICTSPLAYVPRTQALYSDLGFVLLGFLAADRAGEPLDRAFARAIASVMDGRDGRDWRDADTAPTLAFGVTPDQRARTAPTEALPEDRRAGRLAGQVHDNYAAALGGVAGHAGLFGTAREVGDLAREILQAVTVGPTTLLPATLVQRSVQKSTVPNSSRALGWDTMLPTSSCGRRMSPGAFGHVGFTGTSLWIDPVRDRYFVLLTNRACGGGSLDEMRTVRRQFHDALAEV
ncbi:MAG: serine hydrolase domain-containing protein [Vicinamibacterales bacterium]